jgi:UDP-N-acetylglucosamine--N-acetylmuramyl-(pentapeptide) pyrophosphoryl-undecaprenol N-acetylglucosamine transferase
MRALFMVTGRGIGGDAVIAINISKALTKYNLHCEFALDYSASGLLFEKEGINWYKTSIPQAGGHAATKISIIKAGFKTIKAIFDAIKLYKKVKPDIIVGVIGGGSVVGCLAAKLSNTPSLGISATPYDSMVSKITTTIALPESPLFKRKITTKNIHKSYIPVKADIINGNRQKALEYMPNGFKKDIPTLVLSSGSSLFEKMAIASSKISKIGINANIVVVGHLLDKNYIKFLKMGDILYLGYIDWMNDLYKLADVAILSDDGMMVHEAIACNLPVITLPKVKYGRYHGMSNIFKGAVIESDLDKIGTILKEILKNREQIQHSTSKYSKNVLKSSDRIAKIIYNCIKT